MTLEATSTPRPTILALVTYYRQRWDIYLPTRNFNLASVIVLDADGNAYYTPRVFDIDGKRVSAKVI